MKKKLTLLLALAMLSAELLSGCSTFAGDENIKQQDISLDIDEDYEIYSDMTDLEADEALECESTDESVAVVRNGNHICALRAGNTVITVKAQDETTRYNVTVNAGDVGERSTVISSEGISENDLYIGYGFNAFSGNELDASSMSKMPLLDWNKIYNSENFIMMDSESKNTVSAYAERSVDTLINKYSNKSTVSLSVNIFGLGNIRRNLADKYEENINGYSSDTEIVNHLSVSYQRASLWLREDRNNGGYSALLTDEAAEDLYGKNCLSAKNFVEKYGTHVLVSGIYGQKIDCNYAITDGAGSPSSTPLGVFKNYDQLKDNNIDYYNDRILKLTFNYNPTDAEMFRGMNILEEDIDCHEGRTCTDYKLSYKVLGCTGFFDNMPADYRTKDCYKLRGTCLVEFTNTYREWQQYMDSYYKNAPDDVGTLIGPKNSNSLVQVWDLIPKSYENYHKRVDEFINYLSDEA